MIKDNKNKIFSMSGITFITKIHDGNFAVITMNGILKIILGKKPFNCLKTKQITKGVELYNLKEIYIKNKGLDIKHNNNINDLNKKIYLILYKKKIFIFSFDNKYQKCFLIQKIINNNYIGALTQLRNKNIIFWDKKNRINLISYINQNKEIFQNIINQPKIIGKDISNHFILSFMEYDENKIITTSTDKHPLGENVIRIYKLETINDKGSKLINIKNFNGYSCSIFENNISKLENQNTICIAINYYIKHNIIINKSAILLINFEFLEITTILEINFSVNSIFNFSLNSNIGSYKRIYEYLIVSHFKGESNSKIKKKGSDNLRFLDFYVFEPKYQYEPILIPEKRIITNSTIDITNSFLLNKNNLVIFQTDQISIYSLSI